MTGAHITGIDFSRVGIEQAKQRTRQKQHRLAFQLGDINEIDASAGFFDTVIAIDVIYFVNAEKTIKQAKELVQSDGQIGIFYSRYSRHDESQEVVPPESTPLAQVLRQCGLRFTTSDFAVDEDVPWQKRIDILGELKPEFEREGNRWLHRFRLNEAASAIEAYVRHSRCLYHVRL